MLKKADFSPTQPWRAETRHSADKAAASEDLHPHLLRRDFVVVRDSISSTGSNETLLNRFEHSRDRCAEDRNIELAPCLLGKWRESFVRVCYRATSSLILAFVVATPFNSSLNNTRTLLTDMSCKLSLVSIL